VKKKLKVQKAALGRFARRRPTPGPGVQPQQPFQPIQPRPGMSTPFGPQQPLPRINVDPNLIYDKPRPGIPLPRINVAPNLINPVRPGMQPGVQQPQQPNPKLQNIYNILSGTGGPKQVQQPQPDVQPIMGTRPDGTLQNMHPAAGGIRPGVQPSGYSQYGPRGFGPMQGVGDPRLGAATIPGNQLQMQMRGPQQAAPAQPVPAMKKGGAVRGVRIALRGAKKVKIY
jgi:hypothetical protein